MTAAVPSQRNDVELTGSPFDLAASTAAKPRSRLPEILVGTLLVALFALAGAWFYSTSTTREPYAAVRQEVARGQVVESDDFTVYQLDTDDPIKAIPAHQLGQIVGKVALVDLPIGTLVSADLFADAADIPAGAGIVGLDLDPGEFPSFTLRPGDRVRVVAVPSNRSSEGVPAPEVLADRVEVVEVRADGSRRLFIALTMDAVDADRVAVAAADEQVRLIQVGGG